MKGPTMIGRSIRYMTFTLLAGTFLAGVLLVSCTSKAADSGAEETRAVTPTEPTEGAVPPSTNTVRPKLTRAECEAKGGSIVGDIGNGAIHRPDYTCASGQPPLGSIRPAEGEPIATEGEVCCP